MVPVDVEEGSSKKLKEKGEVLRCSGCSKNICEDGKGEVGEIEGKFYHKKCVRDRQYGIEGVWIPRRE